VSIRFPGESRDYRAARERLLDQEVELRRSMEAVAAARRELPPGGRVPEDYVFEAAGAVLSTIGSRSLPAVIARADVVVRHDCCSSTAIAAGVGGADAWSGADAESEGLA
jgi:predicted dithiol-disulfide oxidoreductase (DUF899 family)